MNRHAPSQAGLPCSYGSLDDDVAAIFQLHVLCSFDLLFSAQRQQLSNGTMPVYMTIRRNLQEGLQYKRAFACEGAEGQGRAHRTSRHHTSERPDPAFWEN
jgi:hypothetical protein